VAHFQRAMMMDIDQAAKAMRDEEMLAEIEDFLEGFNQPTYRGMRINGGPDADLVEPARYEWPVGWDRLGQGSHPVVPVTVKQLRDFCREMSDLIIEIIHLKAELGISPKAEEDHLGGSRVTVHPFSWP
jgi:hypothetical protein